MDLVGAILVSCVSFSALCVSLKFFSFWGGMNIEQSYSILLDDDGSKKWSQENDTWPKRLVGE